MVSRGCTEAYRIVCEIRKVCVDFNIPRRGSSSWTKLLNVRVVVQCSGLDRLSEPSQSALYTLKQLRYFSFIPQHPASTWCSGLRTYPPGVSACCQPFRTVHKERGGNAAIDERKRDGVRRIFMPMLVADITLLAGQRMRYIGSRFTLCPWLDLELIRGESYST